MDHLIDMFLDIKKFKRIFFIYRKLKEVSLGYKMGYSKFIEISIILDQSNHPYWETVEVVMSWDLRKILIKLGSTTTKNERECEVR